MPRDRVSHAPRHHSEREERDSNPRAPSPGPTVFKTVAFVRSAILPPPILAGQAGCDLTSLLEAGCQVLTIANQWVRSPPIT